MQQGRTIEVISTRTWKLVLVQEGTDRSCEFCCLYDVSRFGELISARTWIYIFFLELMLALEEFFGLCERKFILMGEAFAGIVFSRSRQSQFFFFGGQIPFLPRKTT